MGRPQDRSGGPTKGAKLTGGNLPDCRRKRPFTTNPFGVTLVPRYREALHQSPGSGNPTKGAPSPPTINKIQ
ncbi:MAG: hypothetical protein ACHBN1_31980 [Heteroscytonema crispum UTEX LB 1556]